MTVFGTATNEISYGDGALRRRVVIYDEDVVFANLLQSFFREENSRSDSFPGPGRVSPDIFFIDLLFAREMNPPAEEFVKIFPEAVYILLIPGGFRENGLKEKMPFFDGFLGKEGVNPDSLKEEVEKAERKCFGRLKREEGDSPLCLHPESSSFIHKKKIFFMNNLSSVFERPLDQLIQFVYISLQRLHRRETDKVGSYLGEIKMIAEELISYVHDLKEISLLKAGESHFHTEDVDAGEFIKVIRRQYRPIAESRSVQLLFDIQISQSFIHVDYNKLFKVVNILMRNAFTSVLSGGVVKVSAYRKGEVLELSIEDDGPGTGEDETVFDIYEQVLFQKRSGETSGFGLSICKELMVRQNGDIRLEKNVLSSGSRFILSLPPVKTVLD